MQSPIPYLTATTPWHCLRPRRQDWLWAMSTDKVYGFDTELTLMKILTVVNRVCYRLVVLWWKRKHRQVLMSPSKKKKKTPLSPLCVALSLPNVPLADKDTSVVDALGKSKLEDLCLKPPLQEILDLQAQDIIELHLTLIEHTDSHQTPEQSVTWKTTNIHKTSFKHTTTETCSKIYAEQEYWPHWRGIRDTMVKSDTLYI